MYELIKSKRQQIWTCKVGDTIKDTYHRSYQICLWVLWVEVVVDFMGFVSAGRVGFFHGGGGGWFVVANVVVMGG